MQFTKGNIFAFQKYLRQGILSKWLIYHGDQIVLDIAVTIAVPAATPIIPHFSEITKYMLNKILATAVPKETKDTKPILLSACGTIFPLA